MSATPRRRDDQLTTAQQRWKALMGEARLSGVVSVAMAVRHEVPTRTLRRRAAKEGLVRLQPGVWLVSGYEATHRRRCHAVQQRAGTEVVIAGRSAALAHGLRCEEPDVVDVAVGRDRDVPSVAGVRGRESRQLLDGDMECQTDGLWVTTAAWTVGDLSRLVEAEAVLYAAIAGRQLGLFTEAELGEVCARLWPAAGTATLGWVLGEMQALDSGFEWTVRRGLALAGLPDPHPEPYELRCPDGTAIHLDIAWPVWRVGLEVMGASAHGLQSSRTDQIRHNQATAGEWTILYVGWERWRDERDKVLAELRAVLRARGAPV